MYSILIGNNKGKFYSSIFVPYISTCFCFQITPYWLIIYKENLPPIRSLGTYRRCLHCPLAATDSVAGSLLVPPLILSPGSTTFVAHQHQLLPTPLSAPCSCPSHWYERRSRNLSPSALITCRRFVSPGSLAAAIRPTRLLSRSASSRPANSLSMPRKYFVEKICDLWLVTV